MRFSVAYFARWIAFICFFVGLTQSFLSAADSAPRPFVCPLFGDNMVLQRGKPNKIWGWTKPGATVTVTIEGKATKGQAAADGKWMATVEVPAPGGPYEVRVDGEDHLVFHHVLVGDIWLCGGQSNMALALRVAKGGNEESKIERPLIRMFTVAQKVAYAPEEVPLGQWKGWSEENAANFSAVAYFFAVKLQDTLHVPIGLVEDCLGGSPAESWMSRESLVSSGEFAPQLAEMGRLKDKGGPVHGSFLMHWLEDYDEGGKDDAWAKPEFDDSAWNEVKIPDDGKELNPANGPNVIWLRRTITVPSNAPTTGAQMTLGAIYKMDTTYLNGRWIGASSWSENPRKYRIPPDVLHAGVNVMAIRVFRSHGERSFESPADALEIVLSDGTKLPLAGVWKGKLTAGAKESLPLPLDVENYPTMPACLYNGMIAPLASLQITGVIWYQGEANQTRGAQYKKLLPLLIANWRSLFQQDDFPFLIVGLPAFMAHRDEPSSDGWTEVRDAQAWTAHNVPHTRLAVTVDTGEANNIHPTEKRIVSERLAFAALAEHYGMKAPSEGPTYTSVEKVPHGMRIRFSHTDGGLVIKGQTLGEFSVAGVDRRWHWAKAAIEGDTVVVSSPDVPLPEAVRYAWQSNPQATLYNGAGFPAVPFRSDDWKLSDR